jgi:hypothetical protein
VIDSVETPLKNKIKIKIKPHFLFLFLFIYKTALHDGRGQGGEDCEWR